MLSLPLYFFSKKSLVNDKTVKWVAKNRCPLLDASGSVNPKLNPVHICSVLPPPRARTSSKDVITIRLLLKSLPDTGDVCLFFLLSPAWLVLEEAEEQGTRTMASFVVAGAGGGGMAPGPRGRRWS